MVYEKFDEVRQNPSGDAFKKRAKKCYSLYLILVLAFILSVGSVFVLHQVTRYYSLFNENDTFFKNIAVSLNLEKNCQMEPRFDLRLLEKGIRIKNKLVFSPKSAKCSSNLVDKIFSLFTSIAHYLNIISEKESILSVFDPDKNFQFKIHKIAQKDAQINCYNVSMVNQLTEETETCFALGDNEWFGGHESYDQPFWPINEQTFDYVPYITGFADIWSAVLERYWISSNGVAFHVGDEVPLLVSHNTSHEICFKSSKNSAPYKNAPVYTNDLNYTMCTGADIKTLHMYMIRNYLGIPESRADETMMKFPIFTTWSYFFKKINQTIVLDYANEIIQNGYTASQLEIDDKWEKFYGNLDFNRETFPNPSDMIRQIHSLNMRVTLWVHPFCNVDSDNFAKGAVQGFWVKDESGEHTGWTKWWDGLDAGIIDTTNPNAVEYFTSKLNDLRHKYGVDSFKFDAGETAWIPKSFRLYGNTSFLDEYAQNYVKLAAAQSNFIETRVAHGTQKYGIFYRILDRTTDWSIHDGIKSVITECLQFGLLGYPFVLPDIIAGNGDMDRVDKELFIRWTQLTAFLPAMQFGVPPWNFDNETNFISKTFVNIHINYVYPYMSQLPIDGQPIIRPMWWLEPNNSKIFNISDQFLVGDDILVAPVLDSGISSRMVYFPPGNWADIDKKCTYTGPVQQSIQLELKTIPFYFSDSFVAKFNLKVNQKCRQ